MFDALICLSHILEQKSVWQLKLGCMWVMKQVNELKDANISTIEG